MKYFKNIKLSDRDKYLLTAFVVCCAMLVWLSWSISTPICSEREGSIVRILNCK